MTRETRLDDLLDIISENPTLSSEKIISQLNSKPDEIETRRLKVQTPPDFIAT